MSWIGFWGVFLLSSLALYAVMVLVVGVKALGDIRALFRGAPKARSARSESSE